MRTNFVLELSMQHPEAAEAMAIFRKWYASSALLLLSLRLKPARPEWSLLIKEILEAVGMSTIIESEAAFVLDTGMQLYQEIKKTKAGLRLGGVVTAVSWLSRRQSLMTRLTFLNVVKQAVDNTQLGWLSWRIRRCLERLSFALALLDACYLLMPKKLAEATANPVGKSLRKTRWKGLRQESNRACRRYADMSTCCKEYEDAKRSMLELVFAPCGAIAGSDINWIEKTDEEIVAATMKELERLFPDEIGVALPGGAQLRKARVVKVPRSVYAAVPGRNKFRPSQATPVPNFTLAGDWTSQKFLGSMEGAVLAGKLAAEVICDRARGIKEGGGWEQLRGALDQAFATSDELSEPWALWRVSGAGQAEAETPQTGPACEHGAQRRLAYDGS
ncbi:15-cis-phytoene desaturase [Symbiodinium microadriaticum]|uniref:15-cis-phytoene desaturase n=1 Tax=Symbiodinium microadriaticum TaxID=2951 RepID=A0A1Q9D0S3_SYMMI|nr:15-cis-phytoene desaturase [Symbiodinium microadriaticum]